jgi:cytosine/creatinine deaminase
MTDLLQNARLADGRLVDVSIADGRIVAVGAAAGAVRDGLEADDLGGWLLLPALGEPHAHLDKALTAEFVPNPTGDLLGAIDAWIAAAATGMFTHDDTVARAVAAMDLLVANGVTAVRTHANVSEHTGAASVVALREAAARFEGLLDVQIVALTSVPVTGSAGTGNRAALDAAVEAGVDLIGGCPHLDPDGDRLIADALSVATDAGLGIDLHVDEMLDPAVLTLRELARQVIATGFSGSVTASHCVTLGMQTPQVQAAVAAEVAEAGISVVPLPQTNLFLQGREVPTATPRGLTAVRALRDAGVLVAAGADNVQDPFNLVGRSDPLETAALMVMAGHQSPENAYEMVSNNVRAAMGLPVVNFEIGDPADFLAIDAPSIRGAIADAPMSRRVYRSGRLTAVSEQRSVVHHGEAS